MSIIKRIVTQQLITVLVVVQAVAVLFCPLPGGGLRAAVAQDPTSYLLSQINNLRASKGLNALSINAQLTAAAQGHSNYLASTVYTHPHIEKDGSTPQERATRAGYSGRASENVVGGSSASVEWAFNWWMGSPVHYNNMLGNWTEIGIGFADGSGYGRWYTTVFGNPDRAAAPSEGRTAPTTGGASVSGGTTGGSGVAVQPRPTQRPQPTLTPSITFTPSITYTPRATFTPTDTFTPLPPTATAIVLAISPQAEFIASLTPVALEATVIPPTVLAFTVTPLVVAAMPAPSDMPATNAAQNNEVAPRAEAPNGAPNGQPENPLRVVLPALIGLQGIVIGGLVVRSVRRRRSR